VGPVELDGGAGIGVAAGRQRVEASPGPEGAAETIPEVAAVAQPAALVEPQLMRAPLAQPQLDVLDVRRGHGHLGPPQVTEYPLARLGGQGSPSEAPAAAPPAWPSGREGEGRSSVG